MYLKTTLLALAATLTTNTLALPAAVAEDPFSYLPVTFTLYAGTFFDNVTIVADGQKHETNINLAVSVIDGNGYLPYYSCNFETEGERTLTNLENGRVGVEPPQKVLAITCQPTPKPPNTCLPVQATCRWNSEQGGSFGLNCCSGICAANLCRDPNGS